MEFEDHKAFERWLEGQSKDVCVAIATRAALRVWLVIQAPKFWRQSEKAHDEREALFLSASRRGVISTAACKSSNSAVSSVATAAATPFTADFAQFADYPVSKAIDACRVATSRVGQEMDVGRTAAVAQMAAQAAFDAADDVNTSASAAIATRAAAYADANLEPDEMLSTSLWHRVGWPNGLSPIDLGPTLLDTDPRFDFFKRWYDGMVRGDPLDWELQRRVALIPQETWEAGADAVAEAIAEIEAAWKAERQGIDPRRPEFEPGQVAHLFENRIIISSGMSSLSATIRQEFERFRAETGLNETPEMFAPLEALPGRLDRISDILTKLEQSDVTEQALREEIGRLNAHVAELEKSLAEAKADFAALQKSSWKKVAAWSVGGANLFGVLAAAVWTVSGDEVGAKQRLENLQEYREVIFGSGRPQTGP